MIRPRGEWLLMAAAATLFALMCAPGVTWMDDGELTVAAYTMGGAHPPGHPLHTLLGKLATLLPIGEIAFRVALLSAVAMAAAVTGVVALARALVPTESVAAYAAASVAVLSPVVQVNATRVEVYAPVAALIVWAMVLVVRFVRARGPARDPLVAALLLGCAAAIHPAIAAAAATPMAIAVAVAARRRALRLAPLAIACAAVPLLSYAALVIRAGAATPPPFMWGDTTSLAGLMDVVGAANYRDNFELAGLGGRFVGLLLLCGEGMGLGLLFGGLIGLGFGALSGLRGAGLVLAAAAVVLAGAATQGAFNPDMPGYVTPALLLIAAGLAPIAGATLRLLPSELAGVGTRTRPLLAAAVVIPFIAIGLAGGTARAIDSGFRRGDDPTRRHAATVEQQPPGPRVYLTIGDHGLFPALYERFVAGARPDVLVLEPELCRDRWYHAWARRTLPALERPCARGANPVGGDDWRLAPIAHPVGRGYVFAPGPEPAAEPPPAYRGEFGARVARRIGLLRAMYETARGRLPAAARAAGLSARFGATTLSPQPGRVPLAQLVPRTTPSLIAEPWEIELFGDDLAWLAGLPPPELGPDDARERFVHRAWRGVLEGTHDPADLDGLSAEELTILGGMLERLGQPERARAAYERARRPAQ